MSLTILYTVKVLCVSDVHGFLDGLAGVGSYLEKNGIRTVILMGDYSVGFRDLERNRLDVEYVLDQLKNNVRVYALPGNCDDPKAVDLFKERGVNLHDSVVVLDGVSFIGLGGSNPTPFGTPFEIDEEVIYEKLTGLFSGVKTDKSVLVTHFPPRETNCDYVPKVGHVGSTALRKVIEERQPVLCVCSHIHECAGETDVIGATSILNVGPLSNGNLAVIDTATVSVNHEIVDFS